MYNWQLTDWSHFSYTLQEAEGKLLALAEKTGYMDGVLKTLPDDVQLETLIQTMVSEAIKTSEIEGEYLSRQEVVSSIRNNLGLNAKPKPVKDKKAQGAGELMVAVRKAFSEELSEEMLFEWHRTLFKGSRMKAGVWRKGKTPMRVISGSVGWEKVHFEAPPSSKVPEEMSGFIRWFNQTGPNGKRAIKNPAVRAAVAHLYFESVHPFEDGNGRIGRAIAEKAFSQTLGRPVMFSLSQAIEADRKSYYKSLERAQRGNEITAWVNYFTEVLLLAQITALHAIDFTLRKTRFFDRFKSMLNERQLKAVRKMLAAGPEGFKGGMTAKKYMSINKTSKATATRDLNLLAENGAFLTRGGGRSTHYALNI